MSSHRDRFDHPVWAVTAATVTGYLAVLVVLFVVLFLFGFLAV